MEIILYRNDVTTMLGERIPVASSSSQSLRSFFQPEVQNSISEAEARLSLFVAKHNLSFQISDHATKLFKVMFPDSNIAKTSVCGHSKATAIETEAFTP